jgi:hypothetical protein
MLVEDVGAGELRAHLSLVQLPLVVTATVLIRRPPSYCRTCRPSHTGYSKIPERRESFEQAFPDVEIERPEGQSRFRMGQSRSGNRARRLAPVLADPPALNSAVAANANVWSLVRHAAAARAPLVSSPKSSMDATSHSADQRPSHLSTVSRF